MHEPESVDFAHARRHLLAWRGTYKILEDAPRKKFISDDLQNINLIARRRNVRLESLTAVLKVVEASPRPLNKIKFSVHPAVQRYPSGED